MDRSSSWDGVGVHVRSDSGWWVRCLLSGACLEAHGCPTKEIVALCPIKCQNVNGLEAVVKLSPLTCCLLFFMNTTTRLLNEVRFESELLTYTTVASLSKGEQGSIIDIIVSYPQIRSTNERRAKEHMLKGIKVFLLIMDKSIPVNASSAQKSFMIGSIATWWCSSTWKVAWINRTSWIWLPSSYPAVFCWS